MLTEIFFLKLVITILIVIALSIVAERVSPKIAGIIAGYPSGTAISLFFFGLEIGPEFASQSATYNIFGLIAALVLLYFYYKSTNLFKKRVILYSSIIGVLAYLVVAYLLNFLEVSLFVAFFLTLIVVFLFDRIFKKIKDTKIEKRVKLSNKVLFIRALFATSIILFVTEIAKFVGPQWAGLFSAFPTTLFPLILIVHFTYKKEHVHSIIKNNPRGNVTLIFYALSVAVFYPIYGIYVGTLISFIVATVITILHEQLRSIIKL